MKIIAIDPGTAITGFAVLEQVGAKISLLEVGVIRTSAEQNLASRLKTIYQDLKLLIEQFDPRVCVVEQIFFTTNQKTVIAVSQARGVVLLLSSLKDLEIAEFTPLQVKNTLTGYGRATKSQIQLAVQARLKLPTIPKPDDAADAIAIGLTYFSYNRARQQYNR